VKNSTGGELSNVLVEGVLPSGLKISDTAGPASMHWKIPKLAAGESKSFSVNLLAPAEGSYIIKARVTADGGKISSATSAVKVAKEK
jgi:uncharacterized membrane protein